MKESIRQRLQAHYDEAARLLNHGNTADALKLLKDIYEVDYTFNNIAEIVEASYMSPERDWVSEFRNKLAQDDLGN